MTKYLKLFNYSDYIILILSLIMIPIFLNNMTFSEMILYANYITLVPNNIMLIILYKKIGILNKIKNFVICRKTNKVSMLICCLFCILVALIYLLIIYLSVAFIAHVSSNSEISIIFTILLNSILFVLESLIVSLQFNKKTNILFVIIPLIINMAFHYIFFN